MTKHLDSDSQGQRDRLVIEITPAMIDAGVVVLRRELGGETEGANRFVDFPEAVEAILVAALNPASLTGA